MTISNFFRLISISLLFSGFISCKGKPDAPKEKVSADTAVPVAPPATEGAAPVSLVCRDRGTDSLGTPHHDVFLSVGGAETKVNSINSCAEIAKEDYARHEIPADAVAACGGWWAGAGDYYYVVMKEGKPVVFEGWQEEGQNDNGFHWKELKLK